MRGRILWTCLLALIVSTAVWADGQIEGKIATESGKGLGGVSVVVSELGLVDLTQNNGSFKFNGVPAGTYTMTFSLGDETATEDGVTVTDGSITTVAKNVDWDPSFAETITVFSASKRRERIVEAPAAVTVISEEQLAREATHGQLPKILEHTPGAEVTQNGLYDFNFNVRGFNSSLNRRILTLVDGRNPSIPFLGSQEWYSIAVPLDELESVELVRGPGSALYGVDAFNGVVNMVTKSPRDSEGGRLKLTVGDLDTLRGDFVQSGHLGGGWYGRITGTYLESEDFARSRIDLNGNGVLDVGTESEYPGLNLEVQPLVRDTNEFLTGTLRVDKFWDNGMSLQLDTGLVEAEAGGAAVTGIGRVQVTDVTRPHFRANLNAPHFNILAYYNDRESEDTRSLSSGQPLFLDSERTFFEFQGNTDFAGGKGRFIGGASYSEETFDSINNQGRQTLVFSKVDEDFSGAFAQIEIDFTEKLKGVFSARFDDSSLYDSQTSPRAALVYSINPNNTLRFSFAEAFQRPNYSEFFLQVNVAPPLPLNAIAQQFAGIDLEATFCAPFGVNCGFGAVPLQALGNPNLEVEEVETIEIGYSGIINRKVFLTVDYYENTIDNFISDLIFSVDPTLGPLNPNFLPYRAPSGIPAPVAAQLEATLAQLLGILDASGAAPFPLSIINSNNPTNQALLFNVLTYTNVGSSDSEGIEIGLNANLTNKLRLNLTYNFFDFEIDRNLPPNLAAQIQPNAPENQFGFGLSYVDSNWSAGFNFRSVESFDWQAGVFAGRIESYDLVDITAGYRFSERFEIGLNIANLLDEEHYQVFGGDILERRALGHLSIRW